MKRSQQAGMITTDIALALIQAGSMASTFAFVFSRGLQTPFSDLRYFGTRPGLLVRSFLSVDVLVPLIALATVILIRPPKPTAVGLLLLASSPVAPGVLKQISRAGGQNEYAISLHVVLALLAIITTPLTLAVLSGVAGFQPGIGPPAIAERVGASILLPIVAGMITRWLSPGLAERIFRPLEALSDMILILVAIVVIVATYQLLLTLDIRSYIAIALMITGALVAGHLMVRGRPEEQATLALESAMRNIGLSLLIASSYVTLDKALPVLIPYLVISVIIAVIYVRYSKRSLVS